MDHEASMHNPLERMLLDANAEPTDLSLSLLKAITNNFSDEIGSGGFAVVYKGLLKNGAVGVKKLSQTVDIDEKRFNQEVDCLMKAKHKNIVRFLGYCADTQGKVWNLEGKNVMAEVRQRLLCFEYLPKGSLDQYITDASQGLEWRARYQIIKGICEGLHYLHQKKIVHLDLKPANILLDYDMVPKIADFGLSRCFGEEQSQAITSKLVGSLGYLAPEFYSGVITFKLDIYSLGVIIIEILTGKKGYPAVENILESWSSRFKTSEGDTRLEQIRVCAEIGLECIDSNPVKRPITQCIIEALNKMESRYNFAATDRCTSSETHASSYVYPAASSLQRITWAPKESEETSTEIRSFGSTATSKLLDVHPLEICLPFEPNKRIECPVTLTNRTEQFVGVWITPTCQETCSELCLPVSLGDESLDDPCSTIFKMLGPRSTWATAMTMKEQREPPPQDTGKFGVLMVVTPTQGSLRSLVSSVDSKLNMDSNFWKKVEALEAEVHQAILSAAICYAANCQKVIPHNFIRTEEFGAVKSIDVHPTETWILLSHYWHFTMEGDNNISHTGEYVSIWDYQKQERVMILQVTKEPGWLNFFTRTSISCSVRLAKFIARERWFAAGDGEGHVHIYAYAKRHKVKEFVAHRGKSVTSLAVHPTYQFLLTASDKDHLIKLWDWGKGWRCTRTFDHGHIDGISCVSFNPRNDNTFASSADIGTEIWEIHSSSPIATLKGSYKSDYCYAANQHLLVTRNDDICDDTTYIWNSHTEQLVHMLTMQGRSWRNFACHPTLPILVTGLRSGIICLWDATTFRLKKMVHYPEGMGEGGADLVFIGSKDSIRLVITHALSCEIVILEINVPTNSMCS